ncbi:helix-turn-helix domain-containing protein [Bradyrhizobium sp. WYCCWR 13022]|uniref:helix-turn-helix domain-containing protein n=1 Tax=unclassified Bradyrhizobium TaxID=2631580 RepID=UPI00263B446E|nr:helix-turn-helix domain-containing protein [Bradyrhizobium sp. WYCCWR 13022]MDN4987099.1 helix-turn-helix domain-containing protein [Bradyrhizobium sp. WYCCWR 13022]
MVNRAAKDELSEELLTPTLIRAARALLGYDQEALAERLGISRKTLALIETMKAGPVDPRRRRVLEQMKATMENEMLVEFIFASKSTGEGVRLRRR